MADGASNPVRVGVWVYMSDRVSDYFAIHLIGTQEHKCRLNGCMHKSARCCSGAPTMAIGPPTRLLKWGVGIGNREESRKVIPH